MNPQSAIRNLQSKEWLEADGLGGFASGTATGIRTRRYHALLLPATTPPTGRVVLVNGFDAWVETLDGTLRSLAPGEPGYTPHYLGGVRERDGAYHQGTVWPWLIGPFVQAWVRVRGNSNEAKREARGKFLAPILAHPEEAGLGHISEIADAELPDTPRGCPFQAWSVGEALRLDRVVLAETPEPRAGQKVRKRSRELVPA